jgi:hypothetical protein
MTHTKSQQYDLRSLLWFVLAFAAYGSELSFCFNAEWGQDWRTPATILSTWGILAWFYLGKDLRSLFAVHCLGPGSYVPLVLIFLPEEKSLFVTIYTGCFLGNQLSFPLLVITIIVCFFTFLWKRWRKRQIGEQSDEI